MRKFVSFISVFLLSSFIFLGCSSAIEDEELSQEAKEQAEVEVSSSEYFEEELVVAFDKPGDFAAAEVEDITQDQMLAVNSSDFEVVDSILDYNNKESLSNDDFREKAIDKMGFVYLVEYSEKFETVVDAIEALEEHLQEQEKEFKYIEPNYEVQADEISQDMHSRQEWHYEMINTPQAWEITEGSESVKAAVLDTGIDDEHESLSELLDNSLRGNFTDDDYGDRQGHGTHVAGTVASYNEVSGVMKDVTLIDVKVLDDNGSGSYYGISQGILHAAEVGADVANMSLSGPRPSLNLGDAVEVAYESGTVLVGSSGNDNSSTPRYPSGYEEVIAVGAVDSDRERASFSNYSDALEIMAPGVDIYSTETGDTYGTKSGTSMSAPHIAGVVGLMRAVDPDVSPDGIREILADTAQEAGDSKYYANGIVDTHQAILELDDFDDYQSNYDQVYLRGTVNDWDTTEMELVEHNTWEVEASFADEDDERFKFDIYGDWELNYGDNNGDGYAEQNGDDIPVEEAGDYIITFNDETKEYTVKEDEGGYTAKVIFELEENLDIEILGDEVGLYTDYSTGKNKVDSNQVQKDDEGDYYVKFSGLEVDKHYTAEYKKGIDYERNYLGYINFSNNEEEDLERTVTIEERNLTTGIGVKFEIEEDVDLSLLHGEKAKLYYEDEYQTDMEIDTFYSGTPMTGIDFDGLTGDYEVKVDVKASDGNRYVGESSFEVSSRSQHRQIYNLELSQESKYQSTYEQVYLRGTLNDWATTEMELVADNTWEAQASFADGDNERFKFDIHGDWELNYGDNNGDGYGEQNGDDIPVGQAGDYIISFNDETKEYTVEKDESGYNAKIDIELVNDVDIELLGNEVTLRGNDEQEQEEIKSDGQGNYYVEFSGLEVDVDYSVSFSKTTNYNNHYSGTTSFSNEEEKDLEAELIVSEREQYKTVGIRLSIEDSDGRRRVEEELEGKKAQLYYEGEYETDIEISDTGFARFSGYLGDYTVKVDTIGNNDYRYQGEVDFEVTTLHPRPPQTEDLYLTETSAYESEYEQVYLRGTLNDWDTTEMELVADNTWEAEVSFADGDNERFKFDIYGDWSLNYGDNNGDGYGEQNGSDIPVEEGDYTITFNDETKAYTVE